MGFKGGESLKDAKGFDEFLVAVAVVFGGFRRVCTDCLCLPMIAWVIIKYFDVLVSCSRPRKFYRRR